MPGVKTIVATPCSELRSSGITFAKAPRSFEYDIYSSLWNLNSSSSIEKQIFFIDQADFMWEFWLSKFSMQKCVSHNYLTHARPFEPIVPCNTSALNEISPETEKWYTLI